MQEGEGAAADCTPAHNWYMKYFGAPVTLSQSGQWNIITNWYNSTFCNWQPSSFWECGIPEYKEKHTA
jgi:hypothetical protein